jgi:hypothetical protein
VDSRLQQLTLHGLIDKCYIFTCFQATRPVTKWYKFLLFFHVDLKEMLEQKIPLVFFNNLARTQRVLITLYIQGMRTNLEKHSLAKISSCKLPQHPRRAKHAQPTIPAGMYVFIDPVKTSTGPSREVCRSVKTTAQFTMYHFHRISTVHPCSRSRSKSDNHRDSRYR